MMAHEDLDKHVRGDCNCRDDGEDAGQENDYFVRNVTIAAIAAMAITAGVAAFKTYRNSNQSMQ